MSPYPPAGIGRGRADIKLFRRLGCSLKDDLVWNRECPQVVMRTRGETAGRYDVYVYTPDGKKLRLNINFCEI